MNEQVIISKLIEMINRRNDVLIREITTEDSNTNLLGIEIGFEARDLLLLFYEVEHTFDVHFSENEINNGKFYCIDGITKAIIAAKERQ